METTAVPSTTIPRTIPAAAIRDLVGIDDDHTLMLAPSERAELLEDLYRVNTLAEGELMYQLAYAEVDNITKHTQARSAAHQLAHTTLARVSGHGGLAVLAQHGKLLLHHLPQALTMIRNGEISTDRGSVIARLCRDRKFRESAIRDKDMILGWATSKSWHEFSTLIDSWQTINDPVDPSLLDQLAQEHRGVVITGIGGERVLEWTTTVEFCEWLTEATKPIRERMFHDDWAVAKAEHGDDTDITDLVRDDKQRWHDALTELCRKGAAADGTDPGVAPTTHVVADEATVAHELDKFIHHMSGSEGPPPKRGISEQDVLNFRCETLSGTRITPTSMFRAVLAGKIRVHLQRDGKFIGTTSKSRLFEGEMRRGITITDRTCQSRGCDIAASQCEADHRTPVSRGGGTVPENGAMICSACHDHKTRLENLGYIYDQLP